MGGTFNPIHMGHLVVAQDAMEKFNFEQVIMMPCAMPPHKRCSKLAPAAHRIAMVSAAIEGDLKFSVSDLEIERGGYSYAIDTVRELHAIYPEHDINFIIGSDSLTELHLWKDIYALLEICEFRIMRRPGDRAVPRKKDIQLKAPWPGRLLANAAIGHLLEISSSDIRHRVAEGMSIRYLVHPAVEMYIAEHRLYQ